MANAGRLLAAITPDRFAFDALGRVLDVGSRFAPPDHGVVHDQYGGAFSGGLTSPLLALVLFGALFLAGAVIVLRRRTAVG
jgi:hypothetical protein